MACRNTSVGTLSLAHFHACSDMGSVLIAAPSGHLALAPWRFTWDVFCVPSCVAAAPGVAGRNSKVGPEKTADFDTSQRFSPSFLCTEWPPGRANLGLCSWGPIEDLSTSACARKMCEWTETDSLTRFFRFSEMGVRKTPKLVALQSPSRSTAAVSTP